MFTGQVVLYQTYTEQDSYKKVAAMNYCNKKD